MSYAIEAKSAGTHWKLNDKTKYRHDGPISGLPPSQLFGEYVDEFRFERDKIKANGIIINSSMTILAQIEWATSPDTAAGPIGPFWGTLQDGVSVEFEGLVGASDKVKLRLYLWNGNELWAKASGGKDWETKIKNLPY